MASDLFALAGNKISRLVLAVREKQNENKQATRQVHIKAIVRHLRGSTSYFYSARKSKGALTNRAHKSLLLSSSSESCKPGSRLTSASIPLGRTAETSALPAFEVSWCSSVDMKNKASQGVHYSAVSRLGCLPIGPEIGLRATEAADVLARSALVVPFQRHFVIF